MAEFFKVKGTKHVSVVSKGQGGHIKPFSLGNKVIQFCTGVKKRVVRVNM